MLYIFRDAVRIEKTSLLPCPDFSQLERSVASARLTAVGRAFAVQRNLQDLGQVHRRPSGALQYLFATAEAIRHNQRVWRRMSHRWQQNSLSYGLRYLELIFLKTEWPGHSTTSRVQGLQFHAHLPEQRFLIIDFHERLMVAVAMKNDFSGEGRREIVRSVILQKLTEEKCLLTEPPSALVSGK